MLESIFQPLPPLPPYKVAFTGVTIASQRHACLKTVFEELLW